MPTSIQKLNVYNYKGATRNKKKRKKKNSFYEKINFVVRNLQQGYLMQMELGYNSFEQQDKY
jgi:hypothetical protein